MIEGFTTNPTLMKSAGVKNYKKFALDLLEIVKVKEISLRFLMMTCMKWKSKLEKFPVGLKMLHKNSNFKYKR